MVIMSAMSEAGMVVKLNPDREMEKVVKFSTEPLFKPKIGSVIPAKRRSVKRMMFDYLAAHLVRPRRRPPSSSAATQSDKPISCFKKSQPIYPQTP